MAPSPSWQRRNDAARAAGYRNYYDYRVHDYGRRAPSAPVEREQLSRLRGHRSGADLRRDIKPDSVVTWNGSERDPKTGRYRWVELAVIGPDGRERIYRLQGNALKKADLEKTIGSIGAAGGTVFSPYSYIDNLVTDNDAFDEGYTDYLLEQQELDQGEIAPDGDELGPDFDEFEGLF